MLSTEALTAMRASADRYLPDTAVVERPTDVSDGAGGQTRSWVTVATPKCRLAPSGQTPNEREIAASIGAPALWIIQLPAATDVTVKDRLTVLGRRFEVVNIPGARSVEITRRVLAKEL